MRAIIATLAAIVVVAASACSSDGERGHPYAAQTAVLGESLAILGWNMSVSNLRFDADYVLVDVDALHQPVARLGARGASEASPVTALGDGAHSRRKRRAVLGARPHRRK